MNTFRAALIAATFGLVLSAASTQLSAQALSGVAAGTTTVILNDAVGNNQLQWLSDAPLEKINGTADDVSGSITFDPANLATIKGTIIAKVATMKTGNGTRDDHMKSPNWLDAATYPDITYKITSVKNVEVIGKDAKGTAVGTLTLHGVTKQLEVPFTLKYVPESAQTQKRAPGDFVMFTASFSVALKDFNVTGMNNIVGSKVGETISISAKLFGTTAQ